jgi:hypothetical protein
MLCICKTTRRRSMDYQGFVTEKEAAKFLGVATQSLRNWRCLRRGPAYIKKGKMVRYAMKDLMDCMDAGRIDPSQTQGIGGAESVALMG